MPARSRNGLFTSVTDRNNTSHILANATFNVIRANISNISDIISDRQLQLMFFILLITLDLHRSVAILSRMPTKHPPTNETPARDGGCDTLKPTSASWAALAACDRTHVSEAQNRRRPRCNETAHSGAASAAPNATKNDPPRKQRRKRRGGGSPGRRAGWRSNLSKETLEQLLQATMQGKGGQRRVLLCALVLGCGLRPSDVARLARRHVVESGQVLKLYIDREGAARALPASVRSLLAAHLRSISPGNGPLFVGRFNTPLSANAVQQQIRRTAKRQGLELSSSAGRRAQLQDIDVAAALKLPAALAQVSESTHLAAMAAIEKVERYRATGDQPTLPVGVASRPDGRRNPRHYR